MFELWLAKRREKKGLHVGPAYLICLHKSYAQLDNIMFVNKLCRIGRPTYLNVSTSVSRVAEIPCKLHLATEYLLNRTR